MKLKPYPEYKDSGVQWLGDVPNHWEIRRIRNVTNLIVSNVDKHSFENENKVYLCNYTDVYKNEKITNKIKFMKATASEEEINKFKLRINDVIITKDSESWNDIGVPALVLYENQDFICGYHLAILRPQEQLSGQYLFRLLQDKNISAQFHIIANGVTRYGMSQNSIKDVKVLLPFLSEQTTIARFLDYKTAQIARFIKSQKGMIELLKEQKQVIINDAVTGKIVIKDEGGRLKAEKRPDSSFVPHPSSFFQTVPKGWEVKPLKHLVRFNLEALSEKTGADYSFQYLDIGSVKTGYIIKQPENLLFEKSPSRARRIVKQGDTILSTVRTYLRSVFYISSEVKDLIVSTGFAVLTPNNAIAPRYLGYVVQCDQFINRVIQNSIGVSYPAISETKLGTLLVGFPVLLTQQLEILKYIETKTAALDLTISRTEREIALMQEYRTRLVSDVVTGKIDVRDIEIPDIADIDVTLDESIDEPEGEEELESAEAEE